MSTTTERSASKPKTEAERSLAILTADAIMRHVERGDWERIQVLARSLLRTANDAIRVTKGAGRA